VALGRFGDAVELLDARPGTSHVFDISNAEAFALRTLTVRGLRLAASRTATALTGRFGNAAVASWREPRRMYQVTAQGAATPPELPFFDRGTWQQSIAVGP
jgi:penicillin G amidase